MNKNEEKTTEITSLNTFHFSSKLNNMLQSDKSVKIFKMCFFALLCFQVGMIIYINLFQNQYHIGFDASVFFLGSIEVWKQKSLIINNWDYQTTLCLDSPMPFAALLYGLTGNIFVSYGIVNIFFSFAFILIIIDILRKINISVLSSLIVLNFFFMPYINAFFNNANHIEYFSVMFVGGGTYLVRTFICVLIFDLVVTLEMKKINGHTKVLLLISFFLIFISGLSSGFYVVITVLLPCIVYMLIKVFRANDLSVMFNKTFLYICILVFLAILGKYIAENVIGFTSNESNMVLIGADNFWKNIGSIILGFITLMGALWLNSDVEIFSKVGINLLINWTLIIVVFFSFIYITYIEIKNNNKKIKENNIVSVLAFSVIIINLLVFILSCTTYGAAIFEVRYLIPIYIILCFLVGGTNDKIKISLFKTVSCAVVFAMLLSSNIFSFYYYNTTKIEDHIFDIPQKINSYNTPVVYAYGDDMSIYLRDLRAIDDTKVYKLVVGNGSSAYHWGDYTYYDDLSEYSDKIVLLAMESSFETLPDYLKGQFIKDDMCNNIGIYVSEKNCFDLKTGFPEEIGECAAEKVYSNGICTLNGEFGNDGSFYSNGTEGYIMYGPYVNVKAGTYDVKLKYEIISSDTDQIGTFDISCNTGTMLMKLDALDLYENEVILKDIVFDEDAVGVEYRVYVYEGVRIRIDSLEIKRIQ